MSSILLIFAQAIIVSNDSPDFLTFDAIALQVEKPDKLTTSYRSKLTIKTGVN